jgi:hypothetical protein
LIAIIKPAREDGDGVFIGGEHAASKPSFSHNNGSFRFLW